MISDFTDADPLFRRWAACLVVVVFLVGLCMRIVGFDYPPYDAHSFRQTQTLSTIEDFHEQGIDLLRPKTIYTGYPGTFVLELPLFQALAAVLYDVLGAHLEVVRGLNILLGAASAWMVFSIGRRFWNASIGMLAALIYWLAPLNVLYQRSMLIDPMAVFFALVCFDRLAVLLRSPTNMGRESGERNWSLHTGLLFIAAMVTALIKALYLWPAVLLLAQQLIIRRFRLDSRMWVAIATFACAGICFIAWNYHAMRVNDETPFTRGITPTLLLGFTALVQPEFYRELLFNRPLRWLGIIAGLLYLIGLAAAWFERHNKAQLRSFFLIFLIPPTYVACFADINRPHDYYQLIITPFLAMISAFGAAKCFSFASRALDQRARLKYTALLFCAVLFAATSIYTYHSWMRAPKLDEPLLFFEKLVAGKFEANSPAMVFVSTEISRYGAEWYIPQYIYAANLWGYGRTVDSAQDARRYFDELSGAFPKLEYLIFYGMERPDWIPASYNEQLIDEENLLYVFRHN
jgi:hypothetical protein